MSISRTCQCSAIRAGGGYSRLRLWTSNKLSLTVHVVTDVTNEKVFDLLAAIRKMLAERFDVAHTTEQIKRTPCEGRMAPTHLRLGQMRHISRQG